MPVKKDLNSVLKTTVLTENRREMARKASQPFIGQTSVMLDDNPSVPVHSIPLDHIREREQNDFSDVNTAELEQSIFEYSLINPISVVHCAGDDIYTISSGHRRFIAMKNLHRKYPDDARFASIDCRVYTITDKPFELSMGLPYITAEQEAAIYRDSNLLNRQLSYADVARQIRHIVAKFDDPVYFEKIQASAKEAGINSGIKGKETSDRIKLITSVLSTQNYNGWKSETIRCYLKIYDSGRGDMLDRIESEPSYTVKTAYRELMDSTQKNRHRKTHKLPTVRKEIGLLVQEAQSRKYTDSEIQTMKKIIEDLQTIIDHNEEHA